MIVLEKEYTLMKLITKSLRIYEDLYNKIAKYSSEDLRSINAEILYILEKYVKERELEDNKTKEKVNV